MTEAYEEFLGEFPGCASTHALDALRVRDYRRLDDEHQVYLDYTGGSLHAESQVLQHAALLNATCLRQPAFGEPSSRGVTTLVEQARQAVLEWFNASPAEYSAVFTANATGALKHVGESYPFSQGTQLLLTVDNHNSVNGIREFARAKGAPVEYAPLTVPELRIDRERLDAMLAWPRRRVPGSLPSRAVELHRRQASARPHRAGARARMGRPARCRRLRADRAVSTCRRSAPDFVSVSFYKMFGYPTGVGCLLARTRLLGTLRRPWFAGGTVNFATVNGRACVLSPGEAGFEDGTLNYLAIPAVEVGLRHLGRPAST